MGRHAKYSEAESGLTRKSRAKFGDVPDGEQIVRGGYSLSISQACDRFFAGRGLKRGELTFGRSARRAE
ncbi:MAG: hypothetical protein PHQ12_03480 [Chthoniobacteraceae bacterium]|nr:hypothetical protein [Chthoniobacteraceae bacterium]